MTTIYARINMVLYYERRGQSSKVPIRREEKRATFPPVYRSQPIRRCGCNYPTVTLPPPPSALHLGQVCLVTVARLPTRGTCMRAYSRERTNKIERHPRARRPRLHRIPYTAFSLFSSFSYSFLTFPKKSRRQPENTRLPIQSVTFRVKMESKVVLLFARA